MESLVPKTLPDWPCSTSKAIIVDSVSSELKAYRERQEQQAAIIWLDLPALEKAVEKGAVRFGNRDLPPPPIDDSIAIRAALEAVQDGIVMMFVDERRIIDIEEPLSLNADSKVRYLKLTALRGY